MEEHSKKILYFHLERGKSAKKYFWNSFQMPCVNIDMGEGYELLFYDVPEFYMGGRQWEKESLVEILQRELEQENAEDYYLQPELSGILEIREKLPPEVLLHKVVKQNLCWEYLFLIGWNAADDEYGDEGAFQRMDAMEEQKKIFAILVQKYLPRINHFTVVTDRPEVYMDFTDYVYEEYGIPASYVTRLEKRLGKNKKTVILDGRRHYFPPYAAIPEEASYIDFWSENKKRSLLEEKRKDIRYLSTVKFLDTLAKNGYNTRVNQTHMQTEKK
ncbi:MAG: hypothetical protein GX235_10320 [Clostridiales bacterium]|nr:hypothetical protein [Clostridiales bacterium]